MDVFAFGMILYELLSQNAPFYNIRPAEMRNREIVNKHRPLPEAKETRSLVLFLRLMEMCWSHSAEERPRMEQVHEWANSDEFERLRAEINLKGVASISCACITRITPDNKKEPISELEKSPIHIQPTDNSCNSSDTIDHVGDYDSATELITGQSGSILFSTPEDSFHIEEQSCSLKKQFQPSKSTPDPEVGGHEAKPQFQSCTQIWLCSRGKELLQIFTYYDGQPGVYVCCTIGVFSNDISLVVTAISVSAV